MDTSQNTNSITLEGAILLDARVVLTYLIGPSLAANSTTHMESQYVLPVITPKYRNHLLEMKSTMVIK